MSKNKNKTENRRKRPAWVDMFAKTQKVDARTGDVRDWNADVPNIKLSRAFVVVLILHVVAVGGILAFEMFKPESSRDTMAESESMAKVDADQPAGPVKQGAQQHAGSGFPVAPGDGSDDGYVRYIVQSGDSIRDIANSYNISRTELLAANSIDERHPLVQGRILRIPKALLNSGFLVTDRGGAVGEPGGIADEGSNKNGENGFIPLKLAGVIGDQPVLSGKDPEIAVPVSAGSSQEDGFLPLGSTGIPVNPGDGAPQAGKKPDRPRVVRERPAAAPRLAKPAPVASSSLYTVLRGDTLYRISRKYGVSVDDILGANPGITPRTLGIGKTLRIP
ncbi:MAG: LysM peptidoglycan-binding domain-containing protein [Verrucomicrobiales bacterium]